MRLTIKPRFPALNGKKLARLAKLFRSHFKDSRRLMALALLCGLGATAMRLLKPWPLKLLFDGVLIPNEAVRGQPLFASLLAQGVGVVVAVVCLGLLAISLLWGLLASRQTFLTAQAGQRVVYGLRRRAYAQLQRLSLGFHHRRRKGDLVMRLTGDINLLRDMLVDSLLLALAEGMMLVAMVAVMLAMDWQLGLLALAVLPFMALTTMSFSVRIRDAARRQRKKEGRVAAMVHEMLASVHLIQAYGRESHQDTRFRSGNRGSLKAGLRTTRLEATMTRAVELLLAAGTAGVLWFGVHRVLRGHLTAGDLLVFVSYLHGTYRPMRKLARVATRLSKAVVCAERVTEILKASPEVTDPPFGKVARRLRGAIAFERVSFGYGEGRRALRRASFQVGAGEFVGIVGPSGAGKSTLLALLLRLYDPSSGKVRIDGTNLRRFRLESIRDQMSVVLQEPILFGATVRENIAFGCPDASEERIERSARRANALGFIKKLPEGFDTPIAEAGASLSLGQRQRLAIARAFLRDAPLLLLDEPTNGLDATSEREVLRALRRLMRGRTTLMVAHKLSAVRDADNILVVKDGAILERGPHDELIAAGGWYADNSRLRQQRWGKPKRLEPAPAARRVVAGGER